MEQYLGYKHDPSSPIFLSFFPQCTTQIYFLLVILLKSLHLFLFFPQYSRFFPKELEKLKNSFEYFYVSLMMSLPLTLQQVIICMFLAQSPSSSLSKQDNVLLGKSQRWVSSLLVLSTWFWGQRALSLEVHIVNILGPVCHMVSDAYSQYF